MKEAFEKIKERLEVEIESSDKYIREYDSSPVQIAWNKGMRKCLEIVSEVEAEFENDVCEWKWGIDRAMVQCKGDYIIFESRRLFSFCPYCGKKIKEVE